MSLQLKNYLHITGPNMITCYYWETYVICLNQIISFKISDHSCIADFYINKKAMIFNSSTVKISTSDNHSLICTMLRSTFSKGLAKLIYYRSYNSHNKEQFEKVLKQRLVSSSNFEEFFDTFLADFLIHFSQ